MGVWVATVHIVVYCPECQSRYQLHADLRGRRMRCPNHACRATFTVQEATGGPPRDPNHGPRVANARGELVVPLRADDTTHRASLETAEVADWRNAPPPVQVPAAPPVDPTSEHDLPVLGTPAVVAKSVPLVPG